MSSEVHPPSDAFMRAVQAAERPDPLGSAEMADAAFATDAATAAVATGLQAAAKITEGLTGLQCRIDHVDDTSHRLFVLEQLGMALRMNAHDRDVRVPIFTACVCAGVTADQECAISDVWCRVRLLRDDHPEYGPGDLGRFVRVELDAVRQSHGLLPWQVELVAQAMRERL